MQFSARQYHPVGGPSIRECQSKHTVGIQGQEQLLVQIKGHHKQMLTGAVWLPQFTGEQFQGKLAREPSLQAGDHHHHWRPHRRTMGIRIMPLHKVHHLSHNSPCSPRFSSNSHTTGPSSHSTFRRWHTGASNHRH